MIHKTLIHAGYKLKNGNNVNKSHQVWFTEMDAILVCHSFQKGASVKKQNFTYNSPSMILVIILGSNSSHAKGEAQLR